MEQTAEFYMEKALEQARLAYEADEVPVGAVAVFENKIIGVGSNSVIRLADPTAHAEILALREAGQFLQNYRLPQVDLYVTLEPCMMCYTAMIHARIRNLYYGADDPKTGIFSTGKFNEIKSIFNHTISSESGIIGEVSAQLLRDFFRARRGAGVVERGGLESR